MTVAHPPPTCPTPAHALEKQGAWHGPGPSGARSSLAGKGRREWGGLPVASQPHQAQGPHPDPGDPSPRGLGPIRDLRSAGSARRGLCSVSPVVPARMAGGAKLFFADSRRVSSSWPVSAVASAVMPRAAPRFWGPPPSAQPGEPPAPPSHGDVEDQRWCGWLRRSQEQGRPGGTFRHRQT